MKVVLKMQKMPKNSTFKVNYAKKTIAGNVVELLGMSSKPKAPPIKKLSSTQFVNTETGIVGEFELSETRADNHDSLRKTFKLIRDTVNANCTEPDNMHWITLTYAENMTDTKRLYTDFKVFWKKFKRFCTSRGWGAPEYITVVEPQARGAWHCHCLFAWGQKRPFIPNKQFAEIWGHGFVQITSVKDVDNIGAYLSAYLGDVPLKDFDGDKNNPFTPIKEVKGKKFVKGGRLHMYPVGMKLMRTSRGIKRPSQEVVAPETVDYEKILAGACTFRSVAQLTDEMTGKTRLLSKEYYNTKRPVSQVQAFLQQAIQAGIKCTPTD